MFTKKKNLFIITLTILSIINILQAKITINPTTRMFQDESNRSMIFHGVNVVYKQLPYFPITDKFDPFLSLNDQDISYMKQMGFNIVRLGVIWESVEREEGKYDLDYLKKMADLVKSLGENGIVTLLDAHQDVFSRIFCGEGVPVFYANKIKVDTKCDKNLIARFFGLIKVCLPLSDYNWEYENGVPKIEFCRKNFVKYNQSPELASAYQAFYDNHMGLQDKFIEFWKVVANEFKQNPYVIGLDYWNEPLPGNIFSNPMSLIPGHADKNQLAPFYRRIDEAVRKFDPEFISMYEPVPIPDTIPIFGGLNIGNFDEIPLTNINRKFQALNMHSYCCTTSADACESGEPKLEDTLTICPDFHRRKLKKNKESANKLGIPLIITEFGACSNTEACFNEITSLAKAADDNLVSWAYWMYKPYNDHTTTARQDEEGIFRGDGTLDSFKEKALTRTYIQAYQGVPLKAEFDTENGFYLTSFIFDADVKEPSRLYLNKNLFYKDFSGFKMRVFDSENKELLNEITPIEENGVKSENYYSIVLKENSNLKNQTVFFSITPNSKFVMKKFNQSKKIENIIKESTNGFSSIKFVDREKLYKNLKIKIKIELSINNKTQIENIQVDKEYKLSEMNVFINKIKISTNFGEIKFENIFNSDIEIYLN